MPGKASLPSISHVDISTTNLRSAAWAHQVRGAFAAPHSRIGVGTRRQSMGREFAKHKLFASATSRRIAGDASASNFRSVIVFPPRRRDRLTKRAAARISKRFPLRASASCEDRPERSTSVDLLGSIDSGVQCRSVFGVHANLQSIRILDRSHAIDSDHSLDESKLLRLSFGPWPRTRTTQHFFKFSCSNGSTTPRTWPNYMSCRSNRRFSRISRLCAGGAASGAWGASGSTCSHLGRSLR